MQPADNTTPAKAVASPVTALQGLQYGLMGLPLAFVALPLYVVLPNYYATAFGVPLAALGAVLLAARLLDAVVDPLIGRLSDRWYAESMQRVLGVAAIAALVLAIGFTLLFFPAVRTGTPVVAWAFACLFLSFAAYSILSITHQSWGAMLGGDAVRQSRIVAWREGLALLGVVLASVVPVALGLVASVALFWLVLALGWWAWTRALRPSVQTSAHSGGIWLPFTRPAFRRLLGVFMLNGIASAVPSTLVLFFVQDRLQAPKAMEAAFLAIYFVSAAASMPVWVRIVTRLGLARTWLCGMLLAVAAFVWTLQLGAGDYLAFMLVCCVAGIALGTDLALPGAMLAGVIADAGDRGQREGAYFGWWTFATKLNLALAAGLALPLLAYFGYAPGARDAQALSALAVAYCLLPCLLKLAAAACLYLLVIRSPSTAP